MRKFKIKYENGGKMFKEEEFEANNIKIDTHGFLILTENSTGQDVITHIFRDFYSCREVK